MKSFKNYSLRDPRFLDSKRKFTTTYDIHTIFFRGPQIWKDHPQVIKNSESLNLFKSNIERHGTLTCHCKLYKSFILVPVILINPVIINSFCYLQSN